jgi:hypothetical protein
MRIHGFETFHVNDLSEIHDGEKIFFCKRDWIEEEFKIIEKIKEEVILIVGNSDLVYDDNLLEKTPKNVKVVFSQNGISMSPRVVTIPIGLDNVNHSYRGSHHGWGWGENSQAVAMSFLSVEEIESKPSKFIYSNFRVHTNEGARIPIREISKDTEFISYEESDPSSPESTIKFQRKILEHRAIICPDGGGPDTHRFYETLYLNRIPITFNSTLHKKIHYLFPSVLLKDINLLKDQKYMEERISEQENIKWDKSLLSSEYWKKIILEYIQK